MLQLAVNRSVSLQLEVHATKACYKQYSTVLYNWLTLVRQHMQSHELYLSLSIPAPKAILPMKAYLQVFIHMGMPTNYIAVS